MFLASHSWAKLRQVLDMKRAFDMIDEDVFRVPVQVIRAMNREALRMTEICPYLCWLIGSTVSGGYQSQILGFPLT